MPLASIGEVELLVFVDVVAAVAVFALIEFTDINVS
jgi:hypothetical protein